MKSLSLLIAGTLLFWAVVAYPARWLWGDSAILFSATAALLCLVPAAATLIWCQQTFRGAPEKQVLAVLGGTAVRMVVVIGAGIALFQLVPEFQYPLFLLWLIAFYLFTLTLEVLLVTRDAAAELPQKN